MLNDSAHGRAVGTHPGSFSGGGYCRWTSWAQTDSNALCARSSPVDSQHRRAMAHAAAELPETTTLGNRPDHPHIGRVHLKVARDTDRPGQFTSCEPLTERRAQPITGIRQHAAKAHTSPIVFGIWPSTRWPINASRYCLSTFRHYSWVSCPRTDLVGRHNQNSAPRREAINSRSSNGDKTEDHIVWLIAVSNNFLVARAAYEAAVKYNPRERWLLRDGIRVVERYQP